MYNDFESMLIKLYGEENLDNQKQRYDDAIESFRSLYGNSDYLLFSAPGRTEIGGNHTDHNLGKVLAASVNLDIIAVVAPTSDMTITVKSEGFDVDVINLDNLDVVEDEVNSSAALIRGIAAGLAKEGYNIGGFNAYTTSDVLKGSGLSSSAAFEVLIGTVLNHLYNNEKIPAPKIAQISQYAENVYFGKPSGLMDQMASSVGGFIAIDFAQPDNPTIEKIDYDFDSSGHSLCIIDTKGDHADLTDEYALIPSDMKAIASYFSCEALRKINRADVLLNIDKLRKNFGDRAVLRALHFFDENDRVTRLQYELQVDDFDAFLATIKESGDSSYKLLQNIYAVTDYDNQSISLALYIVESSLQGRGASRIHGGGFAGTVQAFVPNSMLAHFKINVEKFFGCNSCHILRIRPVGGVRVPQVN